jgi:transcriptional regulator with XRE-family HTH domain
MAGNLDTVCGARLRYERELRGWSQADVADKLGASSPFHVSRWERGVVKPSPMYRQRYCEVFHKSAMDLGFVAPAAQPGTPAHHAYTCPDCGRHIDLTES